MKGRLVGLILPASVAGVALGATAAAHKGGMISDGMFFWLWPCLVALLWLALAIGAFIMRWTKWAWPPLAAFVAQLVGLLLLVSRTIKTPLEVLWYSLGTFAVVLLVILAIWLVVTLRTRALEKKLVEGGGEGVDAQALARIRKDMAEALSMLRRAGTGRNAIYELPWLLVMGRPQGGKTFAIKNSGLSLPVRKDWVKGAGGTFTADWFFTNEMIFLDTPGSWVLQGVTDEGGKHWTELLRLLRRHRGRRPLDGLVVVVPADDLLSKSADELAEQAAHVREVIDLIHDELKFRFPVYLLVSKSDLVEGFVDFFKGLPANRKHQIFGWSHPDPNDREAVGSIRKAFGRVLRRMQAIRLEILARTASATAVRRLFFFTEEFRRLEDPLVEFAEALFQSDPYHETPVFRGFYFTSATQGDGAPLGQAMAQLARNLGVRSAPPASAETEAKRSYFLLEMFRTLMVGDEGLVSRTAGHWLRRRRDTVLAAFLPATIAAALLFFALISFFWNRSIYRDAAAEIPQIERDLSTKDNVSADALDALKDIDRIRDYHEKMTGFSLFRRLGMRQPGELAKETFRIFKDELNARVLQPTFKRAQEIALDPRRDFATRADAFYSVVWLRQGNVVEYGDDLKGFEGIWSGIDPDGAAEARQLLVSQFEHLLQNGPSRTGLLAGFDLAGIAESIRKGTSEMGSTSAIKRYIDFQDACGAPGTPSQIRSCDRSLRDALNFGDSDLARLNKNLQRLKKDLGNIRGEEAGAEEALASLSRISVPEKSREECFVTFERDIVPSMKNYYIDRQGELVKNCQTAVEGKSKSVANPTLDAQDKELEKQQIAISGKVSQFNETCRASLEQTGEVDVAPLFKLSRSYRLVECIHERDDASDRLVRTPRLPGAGGTGGGSSRALGGGSVVRTSSVSGLTFFSRGGIPSGYNQDALEHKKSDQGPEIDVAAGMPQAQKLEKDAQIRKTMDDFGSKYASAWEQYLRSIRLKEAPSADRGAWITALAQSPEWREVLQPASDALGVSGDAAHAYFGRFYARLQGLASVSTFLNGGGLGEYLAAIKQVGEDVTHCQGNPALAGAFRSALEAGNQNNSLVKAGAWVDQHGGESLAQGSLRKLLQRPLEVARESLGSAADPNKRWTELVKTSELLSHKFPFSGVETDELATVDEVRNLLGGLSGIVTKLYGEKDKLQLGPEARAWLDRAYALSSVFFDAGKDEIKAYKLSLTLDVGGVEIEPPKAKQSGEWRLEVFKFQLPDAFEWKPDGDRPMTKQSTFALVGEEAAVSSAIQVTVGEQHLKGFKKAWTPLPPKVVVSADGAWGPLKALAKIKPQGATGDRVTFLLAAPFVFKEKKDPDGKLTVPLVVQGSKLATLLDLVQRGLPAAPASQ